MHTNRIDPHRQKIEEAFQLYQLTRDSIKEGALLDGDMGFKYRHTSQKRLSSVEKIMRRQVQFKYLLTEASQKRE
jgi:hypothetical protein